MKSIIKLIALLLSLVLCLSLFAGCASEAQDEPTEEPQPSDSADPTATLPDAGPDAASLGVPANMGTAYGDNSAAALSSYSITEATVVDAAMTAVVAVNEQDEPILTNAQLQFYFWEELYRMQETYGDYYLSMLGLSTGTPLSQQSSLAENRTWEQYFLEALASNTFPNLYALTSAAKAEGFTLPAEDLETLDYYTTPEGGFVNDVIGAGYDSLDAYLTAFYGEGVSLEDYRVYLENNLLAMAYYNDVLYAPVADALTEAEIEAYYDENAETLEAEGMQKINNVSVRHILIQPEGETDAETGEYSEDQWTAAETEAQRIYDLWLANPTEDYFAELANEYSSDGGSNTTGGIYEDFKPGQMVAEFNDWSFDQSRQTGDHTIVKTTYGYHIMYFVEQTETKAWYNTVVDTIANESASAVLEQLKESYPVRFDFTQVRIFDIIAVLVQAQAEEQAQEASE